jgi:hypothetical protein
VLRMLTLVGRCEPHRYEERKQEVLASDAFQERQANTLPLRYRALRDSLMPHTATHARTAVGKVFLVAILSEISSL